jgi:hypothetical protein
MGKRYNAITELEKAQEQAVLEVVPEQYREIQRNKKSGTPVYRMNVASTEAFYARHARQGTDPHSRPLPFEAVAKGGAYGSRRNIPHGESKFTMEMRALKAILARMKDMEEAGPETLILSPYLDADKQRELGIVMNPLYELQKMLLTTELSNKDKLSLLSKITDFTHQKSTTKTEVSVSRPEAFLEQILLETTDEKVIDGSAEVVGDEEEASE